MLNMGAVFKPKDLSKKHRKTTNNEAIEDIVPDTDNSTNENTDK